MSWKDWIGLTSHYIQNVLVIDTVPQARLTYMDFYQSLSNLANGNGHGFQMTKHITCIVSWNIRTIFTPGQIELVLEKLRKLQVSLLLYRRHIDWLQESSQLEIILSFIPDIQMDK